MEIKALLFEDFSRTFPEISRVYVVMRISIVFVLEIPCVFVPVQFL